MKSNFVSHAGIAPLVGRLAGERIMKLAEELYQAGFISYPRTETDRFDPAYDLRVCLFFRNTCDRAVSPGGLTLHQLGIHDLNHGGSQMSCAASLLQQHCPHAARQLNLVAPRS